MKMNKKGFTLVELMIVVAIIGILAAVAIPGFMKYIKDSKTTEAKTNIKAAAEGAITFFQTEHATSSDGDAFFTHQYPSKDYCKAMAGDGQCVEKDNTPALQTAGAKTTGTFGVEPWTSLNFQTSSPVYYTYSYKATAGTGSAGSTFDLQAAAKLDKNTAVDSCFTIAGKVNADGDPEMGAIIDKSEASPACTTF